MKRKDGESYKAYRDRLRKFNKIRRLYLRGRVLWPSRYYGTAFRMIDHRGPCYVDKAGYNRVAI